jgi:hypothetical protein
MGIIIDGMLQASLALNGAIVFHVSFRMLVSKSKGMDVVMGPDTQARRILASVYLAVGVVSMKALTLEKDEAVKVAVPLLWFQIVYKSITALTCKSFNPVIVTNQIVTVVHLYTLYSLKSEGYPSYLP